MKKIAGIPKTKVANRKPARVLTRFATNILQAELEAWTALLEVRIGDALEEDGDGQSGERCHHKVGAPEEYDEGKDGCAGERAGGEEKGNGHAGEDDGARSPLIDHDGRCHHLSIVPRMKQRQTDRHREGRAGRWVAEAECERAHQAPAEPAGASMRANAEAGGAHPAARSRSHDLGAPAGTLR